jgi:hypothetical protein
MGAMAVRLGSWRAPNCSGSNNKVAAAWGMIQGFPLTNWLMALDGKTASLAWTSAAVFFGFFSLDGVVHYPR